MVSSSGLTDVVAALAAAARANAQPQLSRDANLSGTVICSVHLDARELDYLCPVCTENLIRVDEVAESPKLAQ